MDGTRSNDVQHDVTDERSTGKLIIEGHNCCRCCKKGRLARCYDGIAGKELPWGVVRQDREQKHGAIYNSRRVPQN